MRPITLTQKQRQTLISDFEKFLETYRLNSDTVNYAGKISNILLNNIKKPTVTFSKMAWDKIQQLVATCDKEVAWYCTVTKDKNKYLVKDVLVYPQTVTGATVRVDDKLIAEWMNNLDDNTFNNIRLQGHSHVNFSVSPSSTDNEYYNEILQGLPKNDFYIFFIINKKNDIWITLFDFVQNVIFQTTDIIVDVEGLTNYSAWLQKSLELVKEPPKKQTSFGGGSVFDEYDNYIGGKYTRGSK